MVAANGTTGTPSSGTTASAGGGITSGSGQPITTPTVPIDPAPPSSTGGSAAESGNAANAPAAADAGTPATAVPNTPVPPAGTVINPAAQQALDNAANGEAAATTAKGYINGTKMASSGSVINNSSLSVAQQNIISTIQQSGDQTGALTETLIDSVVNDSGYNLLSDGKYGSNNGYDHVVQAPDGAVTIILDSKPINSSGGVQLGSILSGDVQLSPGWIDSVLDNLPNDSAAKQAILQAQENGTLKTAVAGVDQSTGNVVITPVSVPAKPVSTPPAPPNPP